LFLWFPINIRSSLISLTLCISLKLNVSLFSSIISGSLYQVSYLDIESCTSLPCSMARNATIKVTVRFDDNGKYKYINALIRPDPQRKKPLLAFCEQKSVGTKNRSSAGEEFRSGGWRMFWGARCIENPPKPQSIR